MWVFHRVGSDFWPPDKASVAPNLLASAICFVTGYVVALRKRLNKIHDHLDELHRHHGIGKYKEPT